ncbi:MAG: phosphatase PAP2 family protein, partial [Cyclobacteriaceae bacterium]|nr:phosphatase PAP2 family protein [Cyclobacteriaceae bacterium]
FLLFDRKWWTYLLIVWAFLVGYSRIYLGVHYPGDVATGMLIGLGLAWLSYRLMPKRWLSPG